MVVVVGVGGGGKGELLVDVVVGTGVVFSALELFVVCVEVGSPGFPIVIHPSPVMKVVSAPPPPPKGSRPVIVLVTTIIWGRDWTRVLSSTAATRKVGDLILESGLEGQGDREKPQISQHLHVLYMQSSANHIKKRIYFGAKNVKITIQHPKIRFRLFGYVPGNNPR
jgi:hypothetical protein